jgi:hypothetical protein
MRFFYIRIVVGDAFQSVFLFCLKIHQNNIYFLFFKIYF